MQGATIVMCSQYKAVKCSSLSTLCSLSLTDIRLLATADILANMAHKHRNSRRAGPRLTVKQQYPSRSCTLSCLQSHTPAD